MQLRINVTSKRESNKYFIFSVSVAVVIQQVMRMRRIKLSSVASRLYHIFPH
jgi:hypothetical protein